MSPQFKLAILTDEVSQDLNDVVRFAREFHLDGIELRSLFGKAFKDLAPEDIARVKTGCADAGLQIAGCASPVFKCELDQPADIAAHIDIFKRAVDVAMELESDLVRVFAFMRRPTPTSADDIARAAEHFPKLLDAVRGTPVRVGIENEASCLIATGGEMRGLLDLLPDDPQLCVVWDPCNVLYIDGENDPVRHDFELIAERVRHVHIKDACRRGTKSAEHCVEVGTGDVDFPAQIAALKRRGYRGWLTLETHWRSVPLDPESQHLPAGHAFSANAEPASRICMAKLKEWAA